MTPQLCLFYFSAKFDFRLYGRSIRTVRTDRPYGPSVRTVRTDRPYGPSVRTVRKDCPYRPFVWTVRTAYGSSVDRPYAPSVRTVRTGGPHGRSVRTVRTDGPYGRSVLTVRTDGPYGRSVRTVRTGDVLKQLLGCFAGIFFFGNFAPKTSFPRSPTELHLLRWSAPIYGTFPGQRMNAGFSFSGTP